MKKKITMITGAIAILAVFIAGIYFASLEKSDGTYAFRKVKHRVYEVVEGSEHEGEMFTIKNLVEFEYRGEIFKYSVEGYKGGYSLSVTYPNGAGFKREENHDLASTEDYGLTYNQDLIQSFAETILVKKTPMYLVGGVLLMLIGVTSFFAPQFVFYMMYGWRFRISDASNFMIGVTRIEGLTCMVVSFGLVVYYFI